MKLTPYRLTFIALRLMAVFLFFAPAMRLIAAIGVFLRDSVRYSPLLLEWGNLFFAATVPFIPPLALAWVVWRISPWLARLIIAPLKNEDEEGVPKPTAGELAWKERQAQMNKDWMGNL